MEQRSIRQFKILLAAVADYRSGTLELDGLIRRTEAISAALEWPAWSEAIYPIVLALEQINASILVSKAKLSDADRFSIDSQLQDLEARIEEFKTKAWSRGPWK